VFSSTPLPIPNSSIEFRRIFDVVENLNASQNLHISVRPHVRSPVQYTVKIGIENFRLLFVFDDNNITLHKTRI
jgi:mRNA-degrading endonuclease RelE of RelBE toxin-antitoxin system